MNISVNRSEYGYDLIIEAENVNIREDIGVTIWEKGEDGKIDRSKKPIRHVSNDAISQLANALDELIYYGNIEYDSSPLIETLFAKLPGDKQAVMLQKLSEY